MSRRTSALVVLVVQGVFACGQAVLPTAPPPDAGAFIDDAQALDSDGPVDPLPDAEPNRDAGAPDGIPDAGTAADAHGVDACGPPSDTGTSSASDAGSPLPDAGPGLDARTIVDQDQDGLDDDDEQRWAQDYLPYLSVASDDDCPRAVGLYRIRPHPGDSQLVLYVLDLLFERDCGASSHVGDNEVFGLSFDPRLPPELGVHAIKAISHQQTPCEHVSECGPCAAAPCTRAPLPGDDRPVVFYSRDKHGAYLDEQVCDGACFFTNYCSLANQPFIPRLFNAGEPAFPLIQDLTTAGAITSSQGWTEATLFGFNPWGPEEFGTAGIVSDDLVDPAFIAPICP